MSLTDKEKGAAIKIAHAMPQGFLWWEDCGWETGVLEEEIKEFADLFLSHIREEQEAVALAAVHPDGFLHSAMIIERNLDVIKAWDNAKINTVKLFTTPPATLPSGNRSECDCEELVEVLTRLSNAVTMQRVVTEQESIALRMANKRAQQALANHAKRMKGY